MNKALILSSELQWPFIHVTSMPIACNLLRSIQVFILRLSTSLTYKHYQRNNALYVPLKRTTCV